MKKLMIAALAVACAAVVQAASFNWSCTGTSAKIYDYTSTATALSAGYTAVLIDVAVTDQATLLAAARTEGFNLSDYGIGAAATTVNSTAKIAKTANFDYGTAGNSYDFYFAILDTDNNQLLISDVVANKLAQASDTTAIAFSDSKTFSNRALGDADYSTSGWYSTAAVPEPTSGLLLLIGMAGLALKRKHA